jgi:hypothetical protein
MIGFLILFGQDHGFDLLFPDRWVFGAGNRLDG